MFNLRPPEDDQTLVVISFHEVESDVVPPPSSIAGIEGAETVH